MDHRLTPPRPATSDPALVPLHRHVENMVEEDRTLGIAVPPEHGFGLRQRTKTVDLIASNRIEGLTGVHSRGTNAFRALRQARESLAGTAGGDPSQWVEALCRGHQWLAAHGVLDGQPSGGFRNVDVAVANHRAPPAAEVPRLMTYWAATYNTGAVSSTAVAVIDALCAHHRLLYIHPFRDGNGRIARLDLDARLRAAGLHCGLAWAVSGGLYRAEAQYRHALARADEPRRGDRDGRGALSQLGLIAYCEAMVAILQVEIKRQKRRIVGVARVNKGLVGGVYGSARDE